MTLAFIKQINEYVIDATLEASDEEILSTIGDNGYSSQDDINHARSLIAQAVKEQRAYRLAQKKIAFQAYKQKQKNILDNCATKRSIPEMLSDIVAAIQNMDTVPNGIILAFREQGQDGGEDDIKGIWKNLVELGLIDPDDTDNQP
jgi:hypothetical protein